MTPSVPALSAEDWLAEALETLAREGIAGVRVERLARALGVTKGSFYWHFRNHADLLARLRDYWAEVHTVRPDELESGDSADAREKLRALLEHIVLEDANRYDGAMRAWALFDSAATETVRRVDEARLEAVRELFRQMGFSAMEADFRSRMSYFYVIGEGAAGMDSRLEDRLEFVELRHRWLTGPSPVTGA